MKFSGELNYATFNSQFFITARRRLNRGATSNNIFFKITTKK